MSRMVEHAAEYEWRGEGEGAEVVLYAPDERGADLAFERVSRATRLPGLESPLCAVASRGDLGWAAVSASHAAPDLSSVPVRGLLLVAEAATRDLGVRPEEIRSLLSEVRLPRLTAAWTRRICETGARSAAEEGLIEEEDLPLLCARISLSIFIASRMQRGSSAATPWPSDTRTLTIVPCIGATTAPPPIAGRRVTPPLRRTGGPCSRPSLCFP